MPMLPSVRHYTCARCRRQVFICRHCDRGNHYCAGACAVEARRESLRQAGRRYRATPPGRHHNAARQQRFRDRQNEKVTHQGSLSLRALVLLLPARNAGERGPDREGTATRNGIFCHFCHGQCDSYLSSNSHYGKGQALLALTVVETSRIQSENEPQYRFLCLVGARNGRENFRGIRSANIMRIAGI